MIYKLLFLTIIAILSVSFLVVENVSKSFAQESMTKSIATILPITVQTDKTAYAENDTIVISGKINTIQIGKQISIQVLDPDGVVYKSIKVNVTNDQAYNYVLKIDNKLGYTGEYKIIASYNGANSMALFNFIDGPYHVTIDHKDYPITYRIDYGKIDSIIPDVGSKTLFIHVINETASGHLEISVPKTIIDAVLGDNETNPKVMIGTSKSNMEQATLNEMQNNNDATTFSIDIPYDATNPFGMWNVEIVGTASVPEFPFVIPIFLASVASLIVFYRMKFR